MRFETKEPAHRSMPTGSQPGKNFMAVNALMEGN